MRTAAPSYLEEGRLVAFSSGPENGRARQGRAGRADGAGALVPRVCNRAMRRVGGGRRPRLRRGRRWAGALVNVASTAGSTPPGRVVRPSSPVHSAAAVRQGGGGDRPSRAPRGTVAAGTELAAAETGSGTARPAAGRTAPRHAAAPARAASAAGRRARPPAPAAPAPAARARPRRAAPPPRPTPAAARRRKRRGMRAERLEDRS